MYNINQCYLNKQYIKIIINLEISAITEKKKNFLVPFARIVFTASFLCLFQLKECVSYLSPHVFSGVLAVGLQLAFCSHGANGLFFIGYHQIIITFQSSLVFGLSHTLFHLDLCYGTPFILGKSCVWFSTLRVTPLL